MYEALVIWVLNLFRNWNRFRKKISPIHRHWTSVVSMGNAWVCRPKMRWTKGFGLPKEETWIILIICYSPNQLTEIGKGSKGNVFLPCTLIQLKPNFPVGHKVHRRLLGWPFDWYLRNWGWVSGYQLWWVGAPRDGHWTLEALECLPVCLKQR